MPDHTHSPGGVFLSYAREDTDAAKRIAEAMRAFGVDAWFDQSELRGGDAWDAKIKKQIRECALFLPIISTTTQARGEGYFRREWKMAVERTHDMAASRVFVLPVVIDDTPEAGAEVPEEFMRVQWTRLQHGAPTPEFIAQVKRLLDTPRKPSLKPELPRPPTLPPQFKQAAQAKAAAAAVASKKPAPGAALWISLGVVAVSVGVVFFLMRKPAPPVAPVLPPPTVAAAPSTPAPRLADKSIAVLPFANLSADKDNEFFADGMHDDLITALAKVRDLKVISRTSTLAYRDTAARNLRKIAAELGVAAVLEGSVQRSGNRVRINLQLIDARTDAHLWAETYSRELNDIFAIQAELVLQVTGALKATLTAGEQDLLARRPTENQAAYDLYLRARVLDQASGIGASRMELERILGLYEEATALDPRFALAHAQISILHSHMYWFASLDSTAARRAKALASLEAAQRLAPGSPEVLLAQGTFEYGCNNDWAKALAHLRAAEVGLPNDYQLSYRLTVTHRRLGDMRTALVAAQRTVELNPNDARGIFTLVETLNYLRRYPQVVERVDRHDSITARDHDMQLWRLNAKFELDGDAAAYKQGWAILPSRSGDDSGVELAYQWALNAGDLAAADRALRDVRLKSIRGYGGVVGEAVALHRAQIAWLQGRMEEARSLADEAAAHYRGQAWNARQRPVVRMELARAEALAGRKESAGREAQAAMADQREMDQLSLINMRFVFGQVLVMCGEREKAVALLREIMGGMGPQTPAQFRRDPFWSRLKDDPRFEEILKTAKPL